jgi:predicted dehydrogenase
MDKFEFPKSKVPPLMDAPAISWGILAPGGIARGFASDLHNYTNMRVGAVGSRSIERANTFASQFVIPRAYGSYEELVSDVAVDAIYVASPHSEHFKHASLALNAGKPVLVEKAFTKTAAEASELIALADEKNLLIMEAMWTRFLPHMDVIRQIVASGVLGEIKEVSGDHGQLMTQGPEHRLFNKALAGGALLDLGIYPISFASMLLGKPLAIEAQGSLTETGVDAQVTANFTYSNAKATIKTTLLEKTPTVAEIVGTEARIEIRGDFYAPNSFELIFANGNRSTFLNNFDGRKSGLAFQAAHFAKLLKESATDSPIMPVSESLSIMQTMDEIRSQIGYSF